MPTQPVSPRPSRSAAPTPPAASTPTPTPTPGVASSGGALPVGSRPSPRRLPRSAPRVQDRASWPGDQPLRHYEGPAGDDRTSFRADLACCTAVARTAYRIRSPIRVALESVGPNGSEQRLSTTRSDTLDGSNG